MFSYYGSKSKVVDYYPSPKFDKIIEPFAGSARYALKYYDRDVLLVDKYDVIIKIWHYLQSASITDIMSLPEPDYKDSIEKYNLSEGERLLMGFMVWRGAASPQFIVQEDNNIHRAKKNISKNLFKIRHWIILQGSYDDIKNEDATWFIDPPYQVGGHKYNQCKVDYIHLSNWCKSRQGQVIVCESTKANWLPFCPVRDIHGAYSKITEAIWSNYPTGFECEQLTLATGDGSKIGG